MPQNSFRSSTALLYMSMLQPDLRTEENSVSDARSESQPRKCMQEVRWDLKK